ncbi:MAG TPA: phospholipase D-like domain-containing protein [Gaiellaceae bacterium]
MTAPATSAQADGLTLCAYPGDGAVLLAFDLDESRQADLAGFAVEYTDPGGKTHPVLNRLSFGQAITSATTPEQRRFTPTDEAPLQKFHWDHFPPDVEPGTFTYKATAMLFQPGSETALTPGPSAEVEVSLMPAGATPLSLGFTRGYISSQAYVDEFHNAPYEPAPPTFDFDTTTYQPQYHWLGFHARRLVFDFLAEAIADETRSLDVFAYDLDEPDVIKQLGVLGSRLRLFLDDSASHVSRTALEPEAHAWLVSQGAQIKVGHFQRFSHDKVMIQRHGDVAVKVLSGSANFSVRGLYVQSNNVFVFDDPATAALYAQAFQQSWDDPSGFASSPLAAGWHDAGGENGLPSYSICLSPHHDPGVSLNRVADAVTAATSSVLFAIMEIGSGGGPLLDAIKALPTRPELYAFGTTQRLDGSLHVQRSGDPAGGTFIPFSYLSKHVPPPFNEEWSGGPGQVIHHKFVVTDFNGETPLAFGGSSNLATGGEKENGDNLVCFADRDIATKYAIEAIKLIDHYRFRAVMQNATDAKPLQLAGRSANWAAPYYQGGSPKSRERTVLTTTATPRARA